MTAILKKRCLWNKKEHVELLILHLNIMQLCEL